MDLAIDLKNGEFYGYHAVNNTTLQDFIDGRDFEYMRCTVFGAKIYRLTNQDDIDDYYAMLIEYKLMNT